MMARYGRIYDDGGMEDIIAPSSRVTFQDQSRRGLKRAAFKAVFDGNPFNPQEDDTFLEDYMADNNIVEFENKRKKRIFDRALRRNLEDREEYMRRGTDQLTVLPSKYNGYSQVITPHGTTYVRSEKPLERAEELGYLPIIGDAYDAQDIKESIGENDYMSAAALAALGILPGKIPEFMKRGVKKMSRRFSKTASRKIREGSGLWAMLYPNKTKAIIDETTKRAGTAQEVFNPQVRIARRTTDADGALSTKFTDMDDNAHPFAYDTALEFTGEAPIGTTAYNTRRVDYGPGRYADITASPGGGKSLVFNSYNGSEVVPNVSRREYSSSKIAAHNITSRIENNSISPAIAAENRRVNQLMGGDGVITGSASIYETIPGTPNDIDIITTPGRKDKVIGRLGLKDSGDINAIGDAKYNLKNPIHGKTSVDLDIIHETNGHAEGTLAENIFAYTDPEGYYAWRNGNVERYYRGEASEPIPYSADQLYDRLMADPEGVAGFNRLNAVKSGRLKDNDRLTAMIAVDPKTVSSSVIRNGKALFGKSFRSAESLYPNMRYDDIEANRQFLKSLGLSESWADDPEKMKAVVEKFSFEKTTATRGVYRAGNFDEFKESATAPVAWENVSGPGRNSVEGSPKGGGEEFTASGISVMQFPVTYKNESITTPMDLVNTVNRQLLHTDGHITDFTPEQIREFNSIVRDWYEVSPGARRIDLFDAINSNQSDFGSNMSGMADANDRISHALDLPVVRNKDSYFYNSGDRQLMSGYVGGLSKDYYGLGYDLPSKRMELGSLFPSGLDGMYDDYRVTYRSLTKREKDAINKAFKKLGRAADSHTLPEGFTFFDQSNQMAYNPSWWELRDLRANRRIGEKNRARTQDITEYRQHTLDKYTEARDKALDAQRKGERLKKSAKDQILPVAGVVGTAAVVGTSLANYATKRYAPDDFKPTGDFDKDLVNAVNASINNINDYSYTDNINEMVSDMSANIAYYLNVDPEDTASLERIQKYVKARLTQKDTKKQ